MVLISDDFHRRNEIWMNSKKMNVEKLSNFEKEKVIRECTFNPEFYTPNKYSEIYTNASNDPAFIY